MITSFQHLFHSDIGGDDFTSDTRWEQRYFQDGHKPVIFDALYESDFLPALWSLDINWHLCLGEWVRNTPLMQCYVIIVWVKTSRAIGKI